jgi:hypothetical protein
MKQTGSWLWFFGLLGVGALACVGFSRMGGIREASRVPAVLFYVYFLMHEFRDQAMFFRANGDAVGGGKGLWAAPLLVFGTIAAVFLAGAAFRIGGARRYDVWFRGMDAPLRAVLGALPIVAVAVGAALVARRYGRERPGGWRAWVAENRPIFVVFVGIFLVLMFDLATTGLVYAIVTLHVTAWYVFILRQNAAKASSAPAPPRWSGRWLRATNAGFNVVHLGIALLVVLAGLVWAYGFGNSPTQTGLRWLLSREAFPYWTIMHVTVSWIPR